MAKSKTAAAVRASCKSGKKAPIIPNTDSFSELEMKAIELLVQLSGTSSLTSDYDTTTGTEESDGKSRAAAQPVGAGDNDIIDQEDHGDQAVSWSPSKYKILFEEEDEDDGVSLGQRKKRFRSISELYEMTEPLINLVVADKRKRKKTT